MPLFVYMLRILMENKHLVWYNSTRGCIYRYKMHTFDFNAPFWGLIVIRSTPLEQKIRVVCRPYFDYDFTTNRVYILLWFATIWHIVWQMNKTIWVPEIPIKPRKRGNFLEFWDRRKLCLRYYSFATATSVQYLLRLEFTRIQRIRLAVLCQVYANKVVVLELWHSRLIKEWGMECME